MNEITIEMENGKSLHDCIDIVRNYNGNDYLEYIEFCKKKYNRKSVCQNDLIEIVIISWYRNQMSPIHDHPDNGCILKVMNGQLIEAECEINEGIMQCNNLNKLDEGDIGFQIGSKGLHQIQSPLLSVSLHIYAPPNYSPKRYSYRLQ